jgi:hypothetical protein
MKTGRSFVQGAFILMCVSSISCMHVPFSIPEINTVPAVDYGSDSSGVHIFRADITQEVTINEGTDTEVCVPKVVETLELSEVQPTTPGMTPRQATWSCESGWRYVGFWNFNSECESHGVALRLYRPGYETIVLTCGQVPREVQWHEAGDLAAQVNAVDTLLGVSLLEPEKSFTSSNKFPMTHRLERHPKSPAHREALLFAMREYKRLANEISQDDTDWKDLRLELLEKAKLLKALADGKSPDNS